MLEDYASNLLLIFENYIKNMNLYIQVANFVFPYFEHVLVTMGKRIWYNWQSEEWRKKKEKLSEENDYNGK